MKLTVHALSADTKTGTSVDLYLTEAALHDALRDIIRH
jgi:hypothetical protein